MRQPWPPGGDRDDHPGRGPSCRRLDDHGLARHQRHPQGGCHHGRPRGGRHQRAGLPAQRAGPQHAPRPHAHRRRRPAGHRQPLLRRPRALAGGCPLRGRLQRHHLQLGRRRAQGVARTWTCCSRRRWTASCSSPRASPRSSSVISWTSGRRPSWWTASSTTCRSPRSWSPTTTAATWPAGISSSWAIASSASSPDRAAWARRPSGWMASGPRSSDAGVAIDAAHVERGDFRAAGGRDRHGGPAGAGTSPQRGLRRERPDGPRGTQRRARGRTGHPCRPVGRGLRRHRLRRRRDAAADDGRAVHDGHRRARPSSCCSTSSATRRRSRARWSCPSRWSCAAPPPLPPAEA